VNIFPPAASAAASDNPWANETCLTNRLTRPVILPKTSSLLRIVIATLHSQYMQQR
jgi:hypothetical protein